MKFVKIGLASSIIAMFAVGCGNNNTMTDANPMDASMDHATPDTSVPDTTSAYDPCAPANVIDLSTRTLTSGMLVYAGNNSSAHEMGGLTTPGDCVAPYMGNSPFFGYQVAFHYRMHTTAALRVTTTSDTAPDPLLDTVVLVTTACADTGTPIACNDDDEDPNLAPQSTAVSDHMIATGTDVYIIVGTYNPAVETAHLQGRFQLTIEESQIVAVGGTCDATSVCATGSHCLTNPGDTANASCHADGTIGSFCRTTAPFCDGALSCSDPDPTLGICVNFVAAGTACDIDGRLSVCTDPALCAQTGTSAGICSSATSEIEPNDTPNTIQTTVTANSVFSAAIMPAADVDCFGVTLAATSSLVLATNDGLGNCPDDGDTLIRLYRMGSAATGDGGVNDAGSSDASTDGGSPWVEVTSNDDVDEFNFCSLIDGSTTGPAHALPAGTYAVCVESSSAQGDVFPIVSYRLDISIVP